MLVFDDVSSNCYKIRRCRKISKMVNGEFDWNNSKYVKVSKTGRPRIKICM